MKVLFVSSGNSHYGVVPFVKSQGESLKKQGVEVDYYTIKGKGVKGYLRNIKPLRRQVYSREYDIIHAHYGLIGLVCVFSRLKKPLVLSVMGDDAYGSFNTKGKRIFSSYFVMFLTQIALIFTDYIIVKSKNIYNIIPYKKKTQIIPNGVNYEMFKPANKQIEKNKILWLANPKDPRKNYALVKKAVEIINNPELKLINPFPIKHEEFSDYLNKSSVFVLTSYNEGSPNVIKEAMACNIPIVSTDVGDVREVLGKTEGCYITSFEPEDVADKIKKALAFGKRTTGREDIKHLEASVVAKKIINIYEKVLSKR